jgi:hypothetical protein
MKNKKLVTDGSVNGEMSKMQKDAKYKRRVIFQSPYST